MKFTLEIDLPEHEIDTFGIDYYLSGRLIDVTQKVRDGHADAGIVYDIVGNAIGRWITEDDDL